MKEISPEGIKYKGMNSKGRKYPRSKNDGFADYIKFMQFLRHSVSHRPLVLQVDKVFCQPTLDLLRTVPSHGLDVSLAV